MKQIWKLPAFRWYWVGLFLSGLGDQFGWMGLTLLMLKQTHSPAVVGSLVMAYFLPGIFAGLIIGVLLDKFDRRLLIVGDNLIRGSLLFVLVLLVALFHPPVWLVIALAGVLGMLAPISTAGAQTLLPSIVTDPSLLTKANSLMQSQWQLVYLFGPALAGLLIGWVGEASALIIDAASFYVCAYFFYQMKGIRRESAKEEVAIQARSPRTLLADLATGYRYVWDRPILIWLLFITLFFNMAYGPVEVALPFYAQQQLSGGSSSLGFLWTALASGALAGSLWFSVKDWKYPAGTSLAVIILLWGMATLPLAVWPRFDVALISMFVAGVSFAPYNILYLSYLQKEIPDTLRGRVLTSARTITGLGMPIGAFLSGQLIQSLGVIHLLIASSLGCVLVGLCSFKPLGKLR